MGTQRKKAEHEMFESHFERRASSTKRLRHARAKTCAEDHATSFRDSAFVPSSHAARAEIDKNRARNRRKNCEKSIENDESIDPRYRSW